MVLLVTGVKGNKIRVYEYIGNEKMVKKKKILFCCLMGKRTNNA